MFPRVALALILSALLAGCAGLKTDYQVMRQRAQAYVDAHPGLDAQTAAAIRGNRVREGMTMEQVIAAWGYPAEVRRFRGGAVQYWFFGCHWPHFCDSPDADDLTSHVFPEPDQIYQSRVLFEDGRVIRWQG